MKWEKFDQIAGELPPFFYTAVTEKPVLAFTENLFTRHYS